MSDTRIGWIIEIKHEGDDSESRADVMRLIQNVDPVSLMRDYLEAWPADFNSYADPDNFVDRKTFAEWLEEAEYAVPIRFDGFYVVAAPRY